jgi:hypothetical protein
MSSCFLYIYGLYDDRLSSSDHIVVSGLTNNEERIGNYVEKSGSVTISCNMNVTRGTEDNQEISNS